MHWNSIQNLFTDRLALVQAAIIFQDYTLASNTLEGVSAADTKTVAYNNIAGTVALVEGQLDQAEAHFSEAIRLDPSNPVPQVNLAVVRLHRPTPSTWPRRASPCNGSS